MSSLPNNLIEDSELWDREPDLVSLRQAHALLKSNPGKAITDLQRLAEQGSVMSMVYVGAAYRRGAGVPRNDSEAEQWFRRASTGGSIFASHELGKILLERQEYQDAALLFVRCAALNYSPSLYRLAVLSMNGDGVEKDLLKSRQLLEQASAQGSVIAKRALGIALIKGHLGKREVVRGIRIFASALKTIEEAFKDPFSDKLRT
ncbi:MAG: sel1 repeat family protein [Beijerinckiaceae bacterium]|nr:MAG: sel1 repeat family protein [Beijerinckiaceae bacterium]